MAVDLIADVGAADANAFVDVDTADEYFAGVASWTAAGASKEIYLIVASRELMTLEPRLQGYRTDAVQALCFPRTCVRNTKAPYGAAVGASGHPEYASTIIPVEWQQATMELAGEFAIAGTTGILKDATAGLTRKVIDVIEYEWADPSQRATGLARFPRVYSLASLFFACQMSSTVRLVR